MGYLSREDILGANDEQYEEVHVPEWGGVVRLKGMSGSERDEFEASMIEERRGGTPTRNFRNIRAKLVSLTIVDEDGKRVFEKADIEALGSKSAAALDRVFARAQVLSGLRDEDVEKLAGNSEEEDGEDSS